MANKTEFPSKSEKSLQNEIVKFEKKGIFFKVSPIDVSHRASQNLNGEMTREFRCSGVEGEMCCNFQQCQGVVQTGGQDSQAEGTKANAAAADGRDAQMVGRPGPRPPSTVRSLRSCEKVLEQLS